MPATPSTGILGSAMTDNIAVPGRKLGICALCGSQDWTYDCGAYNLERACRACLKRYGADECRNVIHRRMAAKPAVKKTCLLCNEKLLAKGPACGSCRKKYRDRFEMELVIH